MNDGQSVEKSKNDKKRLGETLSETCKNTFPLSFSYGALRVTILFRTFD